MLSLMLARCVSLQPVAETNESSVGGMDSAPLCHQLNYHNCRYDNPQSNTQDCSSCSWPRAQ